MTAVSEPVAQRPHMPDYGVEGDGWMGLPWSWAADRLVRTRNYWVVTVSRSGRPHALPVWGVWHDDEQRFGFSCGPRSTKAAHLSANRHVVFTVDDTVECVSVQGDAEVVRGDRTDVWIERYLAKYSAEASGLSAEFLRANFLVEVRPTTGFGVIEREDEFARRATRWRFGGSASDTRGRSLGW